MIFSHTVIELTSVTTKDHVAISVFATKHGCTAEEVADVIPSVSPFTSSDFAHCHSQLHQVGSDGKDASARKMTATRLTNAAAKQKAENVIQSSVGPPGSESESIHALGWSILTSR